MMKRAPLLPLLLGTALLSACATFDEGTPANYSGPTAAVADSAVPQSARLVHIFELRQVDGRRLRSSGIATSSANQGQGFNQRAVTVTHKVPATPVKVTLGASTQYAAPILAMLNPTCRTEGEVEFKAEAGKLYRVVGKVTPEVCAAWIEDAESGKAVTAEVTGPGAK
jgi:hypothetical protein